MAINESLLRAFADLKNEEREVKARVEEMKGQVLAEIQSAGAEEIAIPEVGKIVLVPKRTWKYPPSVTALEDELKKAKEVAEAKGDATYTDSPFVRFDPLKTKN